MTINNNKVLGSVKTITYHNDENGYCVLRVLGDKGRVTTVTGNVTKIGVGEDIECIGEWINDKTFGVQFKASSIEVSSPTSLRGIEAYLSSGIIKGVGKAFAKKLVNEFGKDTFKIIEDYPEKLLNLNGVGQKKVDGILESWNENSYIRKISIFLQEHDVGNANVAKIYKKYGKGTIRVVKEDPYILAKEIKGIGFKSADKIALSLGLPKDSILRAKAGLLHVLYELTRSGNTCLTRGNLIDCSVDILEIDRSIVEEAISIELAKKVDKSIFHELIDGENYLYAIDYYFAELNTAKNLARVSSNYMPWKKFDAGSSISWVEEKLSVELSSGQKLAVETSLNSNMSIITGGPGVGKTTVLNSILQIVNEKGINFTLCAPTGKAAKRMFEMTGFEAKTIHRLLGRERGGLGFNYNKNNYIPTSLIIIDEFSMVDIKLICSLMEAVSNRTAVIFVGDVDQLPSVGAGTVLRDMINSGLIPSSQLDKIFRQASGSNIIKNAHLVNSGKMPEKQKDGEATDFYMLSAKEPSGIVNILKNVVCVRAKKGLGYDPIKDVQVLTPANNGIVGVKSLNYELQKLLNPKSDKKGEITKFGITYRVGDKVIQTINNYDKDVFNGDSGIVHSIDVNGEVLQVIFDGVNIVDYSFNEVDDLSLSYAMTIHKSQGSEYPCVVIPVSTQHYMLLERNLIYTGITRGKQTVIVICQYKAMAVAVKRVSSKKREGNLIYRMKKIFKVKGTS